MLNPVYALGDRDAPRPQSRQNQFPPFCCLLKFKPHNPANVKIKWLTCLITCINDPVLPQRLTMLSFSFLQDGLASLQQNMDINLAISCRPIHYHLKYL
jgi:hypothetical protein